MNRWQSSPKVGFKALGGVGGSEMDALVKWCCGIDFERLKNDRAYVVAQLTCSRGQVES